jgi:hypothetical protein
MSPNAAATSYPQSPEVFTPPHAFHVRRPAELPSDEHVRRIGDDVRNDNANRLVSERTLDGPAHIFELLRLSLLLFVRVFKLETLFTDACKLLALELFELSDDIFIDGVNEQEGLQNPC